MTRHLPKAGAGEITLSESQYLRRLIHQQRNHIERLEGRIATLEALCFRLEPSQLPRHFDSVESVREFLRKATINDMPQPVQIFLADRLTRDWRELIDRNGAASVFKLLADGHNIFEARRALA